MNTKIRTYSGIMFDLINPNPKDIKIIDIAWALSNTCRFAGHSSEFISVAKHSVSVSYSVPDVAALAGLLHDAAEAYLMDVPRPLKHSGLFEAYIKAEDHLQQMIYTKYNVELNEDIIAAVKKADDINLGKEQDMYMLKKQPLGAYIHHQDRDAFLNRFTELV